jgi:hypothetical protein
LFRPFRAGPFSHYKSQGFTLGYHMTPLQGSEYDATKVLHLSPQEQAEAEATREPQLNQPKESKDSERKRRLLQEGAPGWLQ